MYGISATRSNSQTYTALGIAALLLFAAPAYASGPRPCAPSDTAFACRLSSLLNWLEATAVVLALVLAAVIGIAIYLFRKNKVTRRNQK